MRHSHYLQFRCDSKAGATIDALTIINLDVIYGVAVGRLRNYALFACGNDAADYQSKSARIEAVDDENAIKHGRTAAER